MCTAKFSQLISIEQEICLIEDRVRSHLGKPDLFSPYERDYCQNKPTPILSAAGLWCAKQAFTKAATHKLKLENFNYLDLEIRHYPSGKPMLLLHGNLARQFKQQNIYSDVAIAHTQTLAMAVVILWRI